MGAADQQNHSTNSDDNVIIIGNAQHGINVHQTSLNKIASKKAKNYALKPFEESIQGSDKLIMLDPNRFGALQDHTTKQFQSETINWSDIGTYINGKCRMVRNGRCSTRSRNGNINQPA